MRQDEERNEQLEELDLPLTELINSLKVLDNPSNKTIILDTTRILIVLIHSRSNASREKNPAGTPM